MSEIFQQEVAAFYGRMMMTWVEVQEMIAENKACEMNGQMPAYRGGDFSVVLERNGINENSFPVYRGE